MRNFRQLFQHVLNPLHVYCRLCKFGVDSMQAQKISSAYERWIYKRLPF